jgi:hypothetical protein
MKWCNYEAENELADFADVLKLAINDALDALNMKDKFACLLNFDNETSAIQQERCNAGTPDEKISFGYPLHFPGQKTSNDYFWIGKIVYPADGHFISVWFPKEKVQNNSQWYKTLTQPNGRRDRFFEVWDREPGHANVVLKEPFRADFFNKTDNHQTGMSKLGILTEFLKEVLVLAP